MGYLLGDNDLFAVAMIVSAAVFVLCYWIRTHYVYKYGKRGGK